MLVAQSCLTLCDPVDCSPPGSSVHGILKARILEWVAIPFSRRCSWPRDRTRVSHIGGTFFVTEPPGKPKGHVASLSGIERWSPAWLVGILTTTLMRTAKHRQVPLRLELRSLDSESRVLTITPWNCTHHGRALLISDSRTVGYILRKDVSVDPYFTSKTIPNPIWIKESRKCQSHQRD